MCLFTVLCLITSLNWLPCSPIIFLVFSWWWHARYWLGQCQEVTQFPGHLMGTVHVLFLSGFLLLISFIMVGGVGCLSQEPRSTKENLFSLPYTCIWILFNNRKEGAINPCGDEWINPACIAKWKNLIWGDYILTSPTYVTLWEMQNDRDMKWIMWWGAWRIPQVTLALDTCHYTGV